MLPAKTACLSAPGSGRDTRPDADAKPPEPTTWNQDTGFGKLGADDLYLANRNNRGVLLARIRCVDAPRCRKKPALVGSDCR